MISEVLISGVRYFAPKDGTGVSESVHPQHRAWYNSCTGFTIISTTYVSNNIIKQIVIVCLKHVGGLLVQVRC